MRLLYWNCRGIARPSAIRSLRAQIRTHQPDMIFVAETLLSDVKTLGVVNSLGFSLFLHVPSQ